MRLGTYYRWLVAQYLPIPKGARAVLDVGCYDGYFLAQVQATRRVGLDLEPAPAKQQFYPVIRADAKHPPFRPHAFDLVFAFDLLEHEPADAALLGCLVDLLRPEGMLWASVPSRSYRAFPRFLTSWLHQQWGHVRPGYLPNEIMAILPEGVTMEVYLWNEPLYRFLYFPLRLLWALLPALVRPVLRGMAWADALRASGLSGHLYLRITRVSTTQEHNPR